MSRNFSRPAFAALLLAFATAACGDNPATTAPVEQGPASFVIVSGNNQTGAAGEELPQPVVVQAVDGAGNPVAGRHVAFFVIRGGGSMFVGGGVSDGNGIVKDYWTLGRVAADSQRIEARSVDPVTGAKQVFGVFNATSVPGAPVATVALTSKPGGWQQPVHSLILDSMRVGITDRFGNRVLQSGVAVQWIASHGGTVTATSGSTATDAQGITATRWRLGSVAGSQTLSTTVGGAAPKPMYGAAATAGAPASVHFAVDSIHVTALGVVVPFSVTATDVDGNAVPYTLQVLGSAVTVSGNTATSTLNGKARLVATAGTRADTAVVTVQQVAAVIQFRSLPSTVKVGGTVPLYWHTVIRDSNNREMGATGAWTSSNPSVASVTAGGTLTGHLAGTVTITVSKDGVTRAMPAITVVP